MIYIIYNYENKTIKLGYSKNPERRLIELQTGNSVKLTLLHVEEGSLEKEQELHNYLKEFKLTGEWYLYKDVKKLLNFYLTKWIDVEMDYVQVYKNIFTHTKNLKSKYGLQYIMWIMSKANENNMIPHNDSILKSFCDEFDEKPSIGTIRNAISELVKQKIFIKYSNSSYQLNPLIFWSEETSKRIDEIKYLNQYNCDATIVEETQTSYTTKNDYIKSN